MSNFVLYGDHKLENFSRYTERKLKCIMKKDIEEFRDSCQIGQVLSVKIRDRKVRSFRVKDGKA
ncbi:MAG: hypothetical protein MJZ16_14105, partial [Bacteroidales bacterium]|nr:hypothetical protein [Bacteroidales bacterium]